jgi:hypothetical protein
MNQVPANASASQPALDSTRGLQPTLADQINQNSFMTYRPITIQKRNRSARKRKKTPSYDLTSDDHDAFISELSEKKQRLQLAEYLCRNCF